MRKVRVVEDVIARKFTIFYRHLFRWIEDEHFWYITKKNNRGWACEYLRHEALEYAMSRVKALEQEKVIYETPKPVYYP